MEKDKDFIVTPIKTESVTFTIRIDKNVQERFDELSNKSKRSRNQLINLALKYALENLKFVDE